ncbi:adenylyl-sulfate kinase [Abyssalbus ytuae]|uniref:Adenylyl-sulfate kinase n=1 Tax=Abyssalbus ytuae TaxID=2926907 RepID=A0A9E7A1Q3_9FLAO|nr:adenylyl-sulfate kinase [Abyssalbus ytuae]UOB19402.1 adenylyl-sulfate kinase [Abyssalbus ytuae]
MGKNITPYQFNITCKDRNTLNKHKSLLVWFTGLSGSGKSTLANLLEVKLHSLGIRTYILDGDFIRQTLNKDLSFSPEDRKKNIRRIAEMAKIMLDAGLVVLAAFVSPYKNDREFIKNIIKPTNFVEIFVNTSIEECKKRDVKGLYLKAEKGEIDNLTGISAPYEAPDNPDIEITARFNKNEAIDEIFKKVYSKIQLTKK